MASKMLWKKTTTFSSVRKLLKPKSFDIADIIVDIVNLTQTPQLKAFTNYDLIACCLNPTTTTTTTATATTSIMTTNNNNNNNKQNKLPSQLQVQSKPHSKQTWETVYGCLQSLKFFQSTVFPVFQSVSPSACQFVSLWVLDLNNGKCFSRLN